MTPWGLKITRPAEKDLGSVPQADRKAVGRALEQLAADPSFSDIKKLTQGGGDLWRLRVGSWRVRFRFLKAERVIEVLRIVPRGKAYADL